MGAALLLEPADANGQGGAVGPVLLTSLADAFEHVNRKGVRYSLCEMKTKTGKPRFVFSREPVGTSVASVPAGCEVAESVNGVVSLRRTGTCAIRAEEVSVVQAALVKHAHLRRCKVEARKREVVVYEAQGPDLEDVAALFGSRAASDLADHAPLSPVLRFILDDEEKRSLWSSACATAGASTAGSASTAARWGDWPSAT